MVAIEPEDTPELQKGRTRGKQEAQGPQQWILTLLEQWLKEVNNQGKFDGGLIAK